jgi:hypothetical protein
MISLMLWLTEMEFINKCDHIHINQHLSIYLIATLAQVNSHSLRLVSFSRSGNKKSQDVTVIEHNILVSSSL